VRRGSPFAGKRVFARIINLLPMRAARLRLLAHDELGQFTYVNGSSGAQCILVMPDRQRRGGLTLTSALG